MKARKAPEKTNQQNALDAFCHNVSSARELVTLITRHLDDHMGVAPDEVTWADTGSAAHALEELKNVARFLNLIGEEA
jgi:hypothetical protein